MSGALTLRPLVEFEAELAALAAQGVTRASVPDVGLYVGESLEFGLVRMQALTRFAKARGLTLFIRNEHGGDVHVREVPA